MANTVTAAIKPLRAWCVANPDAANTAAQDNMIPIKFVANSSSAPYASSPLRSDAPIPTTQRGGMRATAIATPPIVAAIPVRAFAALVTATPDSRPPAPAAPGGGNEIASPG